MFGNDSFFHCFYLNPYSIVARVREKLGSFLHMTVQVHKAGQRLSTVPFIIRTGLSLSREQKYAILVEYLSLMSAGDFLALRIEQ